MRSGVLFPGSYNQDTGTLSGIASFCRYLGRPHISCYNVLCLTFDGCSVFKLTAFDGAMVETSVYPMSICCINHLPKPTAFHILVKAVDLLPFTECVVCLFYLIKWQQSPPCLFICSFFLK